MILSHLCKTPGLALFIVCLSSIQQIFAQKPLTVVQDTAYVHAVEQALVHLQKGDCQPCLDAYSKAFAISRKSALSTMRAAICAYQCHQIDLSKRYIQQAIDIDYEIIENLWLDDQDYPEFNAARTSPMNDYVLEIFPRKDALLKINIPLKRELQAIYTTDQKPRTQIDSISRVYGPNSPQMLAHWQQINRTDSINTEKIERIIQQYGYPGKTLVGSKASSTAWLVIQHAPLPVQEKYLPLLQKAADQNEMEKSHMALLIDRIRMRKGQKQLYGSQVTSNASGKSYFHPIEDEVNVNKRRAEMGLGPLEEYARQFGFEYKPGGK